MQRKKKETIIQTTHEHENFSYDPDTLQSLNALWKWGDKSRNMYNETRSYLWGDPSL